MNPTALATALMLALGVLAVCLDWTPRHAREPAPMPAVLERTTPARVLLIDEACARLSPPDQIALCSTAR